MSYMPTPATAPFAGDDLVTVQAFAEQYRVDASIVRGWVKMGYIDWVLVGPRKMQRIRKSDLLVPIEPSQPQQEGTDGRRGSAQEIPDGTEAQRAGGNADGTGVPAPVAQEQGRGGSPTGGSGEPQGGSKGHGHRRHRR